VQELVHQLLDVAAAKSIVMSLPSYLSIEHVKQIVVQIQHFVSGLLEKAKETLQPLIAKAIEQIGADSEKLKVLLAQLTTFAHHSKVPSESSLRV
jgi:truncated hemoglobin YjbI